jgi:hypothetical protein
MFWPPSLDPVVRSRAFHDTGGELGILPEDAASFLSACREDRVEVLGWDLWVVDHAWDHHFRGLVPAPGLWDHAIPVKGRNTFAVYPFEGDADEAERQLASLDLLSEVPPEWLPHVRVNFALGQ